MYKGHSDWSHIQRIKENPRISMPIFGNGDIDSPEKALEYKNKYGLDGMMIGRAAIGYPWIFNEIKHYFTTGEKLSPPSMNDRIEAARNHLIWSIDWKRFFFSFFLWGSITTLMILALYFTQPENFAWNFNSDKFFTFLVLAIILIPMQTSFEEYLFRGHMMQGIGLATNSRLVPLIVTSVLFGLMHIANPEVDKIGYIIMIYLS